MLAAAVIGSFSWTSIPQAYWLASALWHSSLVLSVLGILLSAQQVAVLDLLGPPVEDGGMGSGTVKKYLPLLLTKMGEESLRQEADGGRAYRPRWKMVYTWQCPMMFMSYSFARFWLG